nr:MAG TPA: hypothetical protein [Caudoviricetes sp.]
MIMPDCKNYNDWEKRNFPQSNCKVFNKEVRHKGYSIEKQRKNS